MNTENYTAGMLEVVLQLKDLLEKPQPKLPAWHVGLMRHMDDLITLWNGPGGHNQLTPTEKRICKALHFADNHNNLADYLKVAPGTVRNALSTIYAKLGVENMIALYKLTLARPDLFE